MIRDIYNPRTVIMSKRDYTAKGNRLNAAFMSEAMHDGEAVRKLVHNKCIDGPAILRALYRYYFEHRHKETLWNDLHEINEKTSGYGACGLYAETDNHGRKIIADRSYSWGRGESDWANLACYDIKHSVMIYEDFDDAYKKYENVSVAEVLADTLNNRTYADVRQPLTPNENLNLLLRNLYLAHHIHKQELDEQVYGKALHLLNNDLETAFAAGQKLRAEDYMPAIIFLDAESAQLFDKIDYPRQRSFYQTQLGQESLKFTYLTALGVINFEKEAMDNFLREVKAQTLWQAAQKRITQEFVYWGFRSSVTANRWMELNLIKPQPKEKIYNPYYKTDVERAEYLNLYAVSNKQRT